MLMCVEVSNIMVCNQHFPDPNNHEQTPDVVGERPWRLSGAWEHVVDMSTFFGVIPPHK